MSDLTASKRLLRDRLFEPVDSAILVYLRVIVGLGILYWAYSYTKPVAYDDILLPFYDIAFLKPRFLFKYAGFEWVKLWPGNGIAWHFLITKIAAVGLVLGLLTRVSAAILCFSIAYVLLVERHIYLNHYYLLSCVAGLMVFLPVGGRWSVDRKLGIERERRLVPKWHLWLVQFQLGIPYFFGAIAKMNADWLQGQPGGIMLQDRTHVPLVETFLQVPHAGLLFSYGGLFYDLLVVPMLLYRRTRMLAVLGSIGFHLSNSQLFHIGVFPWFMLAALLIFFPWDWFPHWVGWIRSKYSDHPLSYSAARDKVRTDRDAAIFALDEEKRKEPSGRQAKWFTPAAGMKTWGFRLALTYVVIQLLLPIRPWILPGNPSWNERGQRFAWRMMLRQKVTLTTFRVEAPNGAYQFFPARTVMTYYQMSRAERNPELVRQAAVELKKMAESTGTKDAKIYCLALVSLNGRRPVPLVDPTIDLTTVRRGWLHDPWVNQKVSTLPKQPWKHRYDREQWWRQLVLPAPFKPLQNRRPSELEALIDAQRNAVLEAQKQQESAE